jgi:hypothetical protein
VTFGLLVQLSDISQEHRLLEVSKTPVSILHPTLGTLSTLRTPWQWVFT